MKNIKYVGLDVHKRSIDMAVADSDGSAPAHLGTFPNDIQKILKQLLKLGKASELRVCYEAGPTGFVLCRELKAKGIECIVVAPSLVPEVAGNRVKTDARDAVKLARFLRSGDLNGIRIPTGADEAMRDLARARDDSKNAERAARQQLLKFCDRHGFHWEKSTWTKLHLDWLRTLKVAHEAQRRVLTMYIRAVEEATARVEELTKDMDALLETWTLKPVVKAFMGLRGVSLVTGFVLAAELGDLKQFRSPSQLMSFLGLTPSEYSSGESKSRGRITKTGNRHARRLLTEAAWSYIHRPSMSTAIKKRNEGLAEGVKKIAWKAPNRLHTRYKNLMIRGKSKQKTIIAVARELSGFVWAIAQEDKLLMA
jgi:transposase